MSDKNEQFVEIPTMTIRKPKQKKRPTWVIVSAIGLMILGIAIVGLAIIWLG